MAIIAFPVIYAAGMLAMIYGAYAIVALVALFGAILQGLPFQSGNDFLAFLVITGLALVFLLVCSLVLYGIWRAVTSWISRFRARSKLRDENRQG